MTTSVLAQHLLASAQIPNQTLAIPIQRFVLKRGALPPAFSGWRAGQPFGLYVTLDARLSSKERLKAARRQLLALIETTLAAYDLAEPA